MGVPNHLVSEFALLYAAVSRKKNRPVRTPGARKRHHKCPLHIELKKFFNMAVHRGDTLHALQLRESLLGAAVVDGSVNDTQAIAIMAFAKNKEFVLE